MHERPLESLPELLSACESVVAKKTCVHLGYICIAFPYVPERGGNIGCLKVLSSAYLHRLCCFDSMSHRFHARVVFLWAFVNVSLSLVMLGVQQRARMFSSRNVLIVVVLSCNLWVALIVSALIGYLARFVCVAVV